MFSFSGGSARLDRDVIYGALIIALSVVAIALCGRGNGGLRIVAYVGFSIELLYLASATVGTIIGTSGFFLTAGILVLLLAVLVRRMEKRFAGMRDAEGRT